MRAAGEVGHGVRDAAIDAVDDAFEASYVEEYSHLGSPCEEALEGGGNDAVTERRRGNEADIPRTVLLEMPDLRLERGMDQKERVGVATESARLGGRKEAIVDALEQRKAELPLQVALQRGNRLFVFWGQSKFTLQLQTLQDVRRIHESHRGMAPSQFLGPLAPDSIA
jgi:hypothetical protein